MLITIGALISFTLKHIADKYFNNDDLGFTHQGVDYLHAFDIHCNSSVPMYTFSVVIPFFLLPIVLNESFMSTLISNALALTGIMYYFYVTLLGYYSLPFIKKNKYLTLGLWPILSFFILLTLFGINLPKYLMEIYLISS